MDFSLYEIVYLITAYPKSEKDNLSKAERNAIKKQIDAIEAALAKSQSTEEKQEKGEINVSVYEGIMQGLSEA